MCPSLSFSLSAWNVVPRAGAGATFLDFEVTLRMEAMHSVAPRVKERESLTS